MTLAARARQSAPWIGAIALALVAGVAATRLPIQIAAFGIALAIAFTLFSRGRVLIMAGLLVPVIALVRRLLSGTSGYTDSDPLVLLPISLIAICLVLSVVRGARSGKASAWVIWSCIATAVGVLITIVLRTAFDVASLYAGLSIAIPILLAAAVAVGLVPDVFPKLGRILPIVAVACGVYGVIQFLFLPSWDRSWMITSGLNSIGQPFPLAVRVFGTSESPGPFSSFMGLAMVMGVTQGVLAKGAAPQAAWFLTSAALSIPLLLTGVRTALIGVVICVAILVVVRGRGIGRVLPLVVVAIVGVALTRILGAVAGSSTVLTTDRYTDFSAGTDGSYQSRLGLLGQVGNPFSYIIGSPNGGHLDNLSIDVLVSYGLLAAIGITAVFGFGLVGAIANLFSKTGEVAAMSTIFVAIMAVSGSVFASPFGILVGLALGSTFVTRKQYVANRLTVPDAKLSRSTVRTA